MPKTLFERMSEAQSQRRLITERMAEMLTDLEARWKGKRRPKAFYLSPMDWAGFMATEPPTVRTMWGNNPPKPRVDPAFKGIPVRSSMGKGLPGTSRLYDNTATGWALPR
jgi:hypothetical protein